MSRLHRLHLHRWPLLALLGVGGLTLAALLGGARAQVSFSQLDYLGRPVQSVRLYGAGYASASVLAGPLQFSRGGNVVRIEGFGHVLLLPLDADPARAAGEANTVQLDTARTSGRTATLLNGHLYLPLDTLARGIGAQYQNNAFTLPQARLLGVASRAGGRVDRLVLDLSRDVRFTARARGGELKIVLPATEGDARTYTTRGGYLPRVRVTGANGDLTVSAPLPLGSGYRVYRAPGVAGGGNAGARLVLDVGPGVPLQESALAARLRRPLIVLDPGAPPARGSAAQRSGALGDAALEVARQTGALLSQAGWRVRLTRTNGEGASAAERGALTRGSDVYVGLGVARFPGAEARGLTLYEGGGASDLALIDAVRGGGSTESGAALRLAVGDAGDDRRLAQLLAGELKAVGAAPRRESAENARRLLPLREAPHAALLLELGWAGSEADAARLSDESRRGQLAVALARSVASYLSARASGAGVTP